VSRWYSSESSKDAAAQTEGEAKDAAKDGNGVPEAEAALKKNLEAKEKEALEWKVRIAPSTTPSPDLSSQ